MDILIGTKNRAKAAEMKYLLSGLAGVKIRDFGELEQSIKIEEDQSTLKANAEKKAIEISKLTDWYVLASDGGVAIPSLGKKWDILRNQRIVGEKKTDLEKAEKFLRLMKDLKGDKRKARFETGLALAKNGKLLWSTQDVASQAYILERLPDKNIPLHGWMSHLWFYPEFEKTDNQLNIQEKNEIRKQMDRLKQGLEKFLKKIST